MLMPNSRNTSRANKLQSLGSEYQRTSGQADSNNENREHEVLLRATYLVDIRIQGLHCTAGSEPN